MTIKYLVLLMALFTYTEVTGQLKQTGRFEMDIKRSDNPYYIIPADSAGMFIFNESKDYAENNKRYQLLRLDRNLDKEEEIELFINKNYEWIGYEFVNPDLYLLFRESNTKKSDLHVLRVSSTKGDIRRFDIKNELEFNITNFTVCKSTAVMGGYVNDRPALVTYDFINEQIQILPGFYLKNSKLIDITVNVNNTFNVLIYNEENKRNKNLQLNVYDWEGNLLADDLFKIPEDKTIFSGVSSRLINDYLIVTGTFGASNSKLSEGIFWAKADLSKEQEIKLIPFSELSSFFDYLSEKRQERMKKREEKSSKEFVHKDHVIVHRLMEHGEKFYLLAEVFDPNYAKQHEMVSPYLSTHRFNTYIYNRFRPTYSEMYNTREFVNIEYLESMVISLNEKGDVLWDQALVLNKVESDELEQIADLNVHNGSIALAYKEEDVFKYKIVDGSETIRGDTAVNIMLSHSSDILRNEDKEEGEVRYWYNGAYYLWGNQSIKREVENTNEKLYVFYINKLEMDN
ncbi:MAG: hypothetical protein ACNS60_16935 [Candidatus Cyclobacteriaceae bacterium M2_1C_046]